MAAWSESVPPEPHNAEVSADAKRAADTADPDMAGDSPLT